MSEWKCGGRAAIQEAAARLEKALEEYDRILLIDEESTGGRLAGLFAQGAGFPETEGKILILSGREDGEAGNVAWRRVTGREMEGMLRIYFLYEFSNRISVISKRGCFGSLLDYVETGVLTEREAMAAFLR